MRTIRVDERKFLSIIGGCYGIEALAAELQLRGSLKCLCAIASYCSEIKVWETDAEPPNSQCIEITFNDYREIDDACFEIENDAITLKQFGDSCYLKDIKKSCSKIVDVVLKAAKKEYGKADQDVATEQEEEPNKQI